MPPVRFSGRFALPGIRSFLTGQKGTEKAAATSEARGTALGLHAPETPKEEV